MVAMGTTLNVESTKALRDLLIIFAAVLAAFLLHYLLYKAARRLSPKRAHFGVRAIATYTAGPIRLLLLLLAISAAGSAFEIPVHFLSPLRHCLEIAYIMAVAWLIVGAVEILTALLNRRLPEDITDNVRARRTRTQVHLLRQMFIGLIWFSAVAAALITFPAIRNVGTGLFASAGVAGLVLGMAARPTLGNLIAGIQVALTEPIRIDDAVVVEGEFGRVAEVNTTYVVVRLWDLRHLVVPLSYFIEKPFQNWTRYSSELVGAVLLYADYTVPIERLREEYRRILESSPLWDRKVMAVQITDAKERTIEIRFLLSAANPAATFDLRCHVRERLIEYLQKEHPLALPRVRSDVSFFAHSQQDESL